MISPFLKATTEGVVRFPSGFGIIFDSVPSRTATAEFVVPRSIPIILDILLNLLYFLLLMNSLKTLRSIYFLIYCATTTIAGRSKRS